jgi:hypothetical protein
MNDVYTLAERTIIIYTLCVVVSSAVQWAHAGSHSAAALLRRMGVYAPVLFAVKMTAPSFQRAEMT